MDWNNINRDRNTSGLGPIEYDQTKVPALIRKHADNVRTKTYGQEVREAQARNAEISGLIASEAVDISNETKGRQDTVETQFNSVQQELTDKDPISAPEIIVARGGESTLNDRLDKEKKEVTAQLAQTNNILLGDSISPDEFEGSDYDKVQSAINKALTTYAGIRFSRMYDITGHELDLPRHFNDRNTIYFIGLGGGIRKNDKGHMFTSSQALAGDYVFSDMLFYSVSGNGTNVFDGDTIIRVTCDNCTFRNIDSILYSDGGYVQTYHFNGGSIRGGEGYAVELASAYNTTFTSGFYVEHRDSFFLQTKKRERLNVPDSLMGVSFRDIMVEGLDGTAFRLRRTENMVIDGLYLESNKTNHIYFEDDSFLRGLDIRNVRAYDPETTVLTEVIRWGGSLYDVSTHNNVSTRVPLHNTTAVSRGKISASSEYSYTVPNGSYLPNVDPQNRVIQTTTEQVIKKVEDTDISTFISFKRLVKRGTVRVYSQYNRQFLSVVFPEDINRDDIISVNFNVGEEGGEVKGSVYLLGVERNPDDKKEVILTFQHDKVETSKNDFLVYYYVTVLKFPFSTIG